MMPWAPARVMLVALVCASVVSTFLSWGRSGSVGRTSYELVDSSRALGLLDEGVLRAAPVWFLVPFLAAGAVLACAMTRMVLGAALAGVMGALLVVGWMIVKSSPVAVDIGAVTGAILGAATLVVAGALLVAEGRHHRDRRASRPERDSDRADRPRRAHGAAAAPTASRR